MLIVIRTDSIVATRSCCYSNAPTFSVVRNFVIAQADLGNVEGDTVPSWHYPLPTPTHSTRSTSRPRPRTVLKETDRLRHRRRNARLQKRGPKLKLVGGEILSHTAISSSRETNRASNGFASFQRAQASGLRNILILQQRALTSNSTGLLQVFLEDSELV